MVKSLEDQLTDCDKSMMSSRASQILGSRIYQQSSEDDLNTESLQFKQKQQKAQKRLAVLNFGYFLQKKLDQNKKSFFNIFTDYP